MSRSRVSTGLLLALVLGLGSSGCGKIREISACRSVASQVNTAVSELETLSKAKPVDEARIAKRYADLSQALKPYTVGETPLAQAVRDYVAILQATDAALRNHVQATKAPTGKASDPRRELDRLVKREHAAVARIDVECQH